MKLGFATGASGVLLDISESSGENENVLLGWELLFVTDVNRVIFSEGSVNTSEDFQKIKASVAEKEFDMLVIDKNLLLSLFDYVEKVELSTGEKDVVQVEYDING